MNGSIPQPWLSRVGSDTGPVGSFPATRSGSWDISSCGTGIKAVGGLLGHRLPVSWARNSPLHLLDPTTSLKCIKKYIIVLYGRNV